jgi:hypothetical protein
VRCGNGDAGAAQDRTFGVVYGARVAVGRLRAYPTAMRRGMTISLAGLVGLCLWAQDAKTAAQFSGRWEARFEETLFLVLQIKTDGRISGTLSAGSISLNEDGDLIQVGPISSQPAAIKNATVNGATLFFEFQDEGDDEVMKFELKITGENAGALRIIDEHLHKMKGFAVKRTSR